MKRVTTISVVIALALLISACNFPFAEDNEDAIAESVAQTVEALEARVVVPTLAPLPTQEPTPTETPDDDPWDRHGNYSCDIDWDNYCDKDWEKGLDKDWDWDWDDDCYNDWYRSCKGAKQECLYATALSETVPDGTTFTAGEAFTKTWTLENTGYCTWDSDYAIDFKGGEQMGGPDSQDLDTDIEPGEIVTISLDLVAPATEGSHTGYWQLETDTGINFGKVWVTIKVE